MRKGTARLSTTGIRMGLLFLCITLITLIAFYGCRKFDHPHQSAPSISTEEKFFNSNRSDDPAEKAIVDYLMRKNKELGFVEKTVKQIGYPIWNKKFTPNNLTVISHNTRGTEEPVTVFYIPFVRDTQNYVNAAMVFKIAGTDTSFSYLCDWQYKKKQNGLDSYQDDAEHYALFFMGMDKQVFEHQRFRITDTTLFNVGGKHAEFISMKPARQPSLTQKTIMVEYCQDVTLMYIHCPYIGDPTNNYCKPVCDQCYLCVQTLIYQDCWREFMDDGTGMGGGSGDVGEGGGGDGSGTGTPPQPCDPGTPGDPSNGIPATPGDCNPSPGWDPIDDASPPLEFGSAVSKEFDAAFGGIATYITSAGVPVTLPAGTKVKYYYNIDVNIFPNGALYAFKLPGGDIYVACQKEFAQPGAIAVPPPSFTGFYKVDAATNYIDYHSPLPANALTVAQPQNGVVRAIRIRVQKNSTTNQCEIVRELIDYEKPSSSPGTFTTSSNVNYDIEYTAPVAGTSPQSMALDDCPGYSPGGSTDNSLNNFKQKEGDNIQIFLRDRVKSNIRVYLYNENTNKTQFTITKDGVVTVPLNQQLAQLNKFNNNTFTSSDEDIAIKACIRDGQWVYDVKYNLARLNSLHPKAEQNMGALLAEIRAQADAEVQSLRGVGRINAGETISVDNGEKFRKASLNLFTGLSAIYDVGKHILQEGTLPESIWDQGRRSGTGNIDLVGPYLASPFNLPSSLAGATDQLIDEATGIVQLTKMGLEAVRHPRATFNNFYNAVKSLDTEKIRQIVSGVTGYDNYVAGGDRAVYQGGRHSIQAAMILLGAVKQLTKGTDVVRNGGTGMTQVQEFIPNGTTNHPTAAAIKNAADNNKLVKNIDNEKLLTRNTINNEEIIVGIEKKGTTSEVFEAKKSDFVDDNGNQLSDLAIDEALEEGAKDVSYPLNGDNSYIRGQKNAWNKDLNIHPLIPNKIYNVNGFKYYTDGSGKVTKVEIANLQKSTPAWDRNRYQQSLKANKAKDGIQGTDQGGHLIGSQFGGPGEQINLVPMKKTLNQHPGTWAQMEQEWVNTLNANGTVTNIEINIIYGSNGRPTGFTVVADVNGVTTPYNHTN